MGTQGISRASQTEHTAVRLINIAPYIGKSWVLRILMYSSGPQGKISKALAPSYYLALSSIFLI